MHRVIELPSCQQDATEHDLDDGVASIEVRGTAGVLVREALFLVPLFPRLATPLAARSRSSGECLLGRPVGPILSLNGPSDKPGAIQSVPTLIAWGDKDSYAHRDSQERLRAVLRGARFSVYEGGGHGFHWEDPARFAGDLAAFLTSVRAQRQ